MLSRLLRAALFCAMAVSLLAGCNPAPSPVATEPSAERPAPPPPPAAEARLPVPGPVAKLHERSFDAGSTDPSLAQALCVVTLHDAPLKQRGFYPLVLFTDGGVSTWHQTPEGQLEPFQAELTPEERKRAAELVAALPDARDQAEETFVASDMVMGVTTRVAERPVTMYFRSDRVPAKLGELIALLKGRLEATNGGRGSP